MDLNTKPIPVVAAVIKFNDRILCVQRGTSKFEYLSNRYEFPGGKVEPDEPLEHAVRREIYEELNMMIEVDSLLMSSEYAYPDFSVVLHTFLCSVSSDKVDLKEHQALQWLTVDNLKELNWAAADLPIVEKLVISMSR